jgi:hypothetical protein
MMSDQELLELAAKAAGHSLGPEWYCYNDGIWVDGTGHGDGHLWNPLTDDGDALRLAVALGKQYLLYLEIGRSGADVEFDSHNAQAFERGDDAAVATRRAIVRAAAEIGKQI